MNISYVLSVLDLYLMKEQNNKLIIEINNHENLVKINFCYSFDTSNKTFIKISKQMFLDNINLFLKKVQGNLLLDKENLNERNVYTLTFANKREITFINFNLDELKLIRSNLENIDNDFTFNTIVNDSNINSYNQILKSNQDRKLTYSMGFTNYITLFISAIWFLDILMISLWLFKVFIK